MINVELNGTSLSLDEKKLHITITRNNHSWNWKENYVPEFVMEGRHILFQDAGSVTHQLLKTGLGTGILSHYEGFSSSNEASDLVFETFVWIEAYTGDVLFEWIPIKEHKSRLEAIFWPGPMEFTSRRRDWYTLLNIQQGLLIPNDWNVELGELPFHGQFCSAGSYMPWFSQIREGIGYIAICEQPWDSFVYAEHPTGGPYTTAGIKWGPSLGKIRYRRVLRFRFLSDCDYNTMCKVYRTYVKEKGSFCSLEEKAVKAPLVNRLIGSLFLHMGIKNHVNPESDFFDQKNPHRYERLIPFSERCEQMRSFYEKGYKKLYLHLDGWGDRGYDNGHPDYLPPCSEAGGWNGLKDLADTLHNYGYLFGLHDQYRDYYFNAETFDPEYGCRQPDGSLPQHSRWAGGRQTYLCATQAPGYVKRNFTELELHEIHLDCAYLDVFTCNEGDECSHPRHPMTREECFRYRNECFEYLLSKGILPSSEEASDWSMKSLVFCHYAPYEFMMHPSSEPRAGVPIPLFNLVYHDCLIEPWFMDQADQKEDYMLYALLNGGAPYFIRNGAYEGIDGSFAPAFQFSQEQSYERCLIVAKLHEIVAKCEMVSHEFMEGDYQKQRTVFSDGTVVTINLMQQIYSIQTSNGQIIN